MYLPAWPSLSPTHFIQRQSVAVQPFPLNKDVSFFYVARNGIYQLFQKLQFHKNDIVLVPDYHHGNEIYAIQAAGVSYRYYPIKLNLEMDLDAVAKLCAELRPRALYITHFIGWPQPLDEVQNLCREHGMMLIEDCALSFMSRYKGRPVGSVGDYSVFCLYKSLPLPNGGALVQNGTKPHIGDFEIIPCSNVSVVARSMELMSQWLRMKSEIGGKALFAIKRSAGRFLSGANVERVPVGNTGFDVTRTNVGMSGVSRLLLDRFDYDQIRAVRQRNFRFLREQLAGDVRLLPIDIHDDVCPLFFPLLVNNKEAAAQALWKRGIEVVQFWNEGDPTAQRDGFPAQFLRRRVLEVPIHQDISNEQLRYAAQEIRKLRKEKTLLQ